MKRRVFVAVLGLLAAANIGSVRAQTGAIEGTVSYRADGARQWRYARYYVKQAKTGELAEAVVAIRAKGAMEAGRAAETVVVDQQNFQFQPETVAIRRGDSVKFTNADAATHNVQASGEIATFNVNMPGGGDHTVRFERAGGARQPVQIGCVFHSAMRAWVFVFDHPWFQVTGANGKFRLVDVPPGSYELEMTHAAGGLRWRKRVEVKAGEVTRIDIGVSADDKVGAE